MLHHCHGGQQQLSCHRCSVRIPNVSKDQRWRGSLPATVEPQRLDLPSALEQPNTRRNIRSSGFQSGCRAVKGSSSWETGTEAYAVSVPAERLEFLGRRVGRQIPGSFGHPHWLEELELTVRKYLGDESLQGRWQERAVRREVWRREEGPPPVSSVCIMKLLRPEGGHLKGSKGRHWHTGLRVASFLPASLETTLTHETLREDAVVPGSGKQPSTSMAPAALQSLNARPEGSNHSQVI